MTSQRILSVPRKLFCLGKELEAISPKFVPRQKSFLGTLRILWEVIWEKKRKIH